MGVYVIKRSDDGKYVTYAGSKHTYTRSLRQARPFATVQAAKDYGLCGNEMIIEITEEMRP